MMNYLASINRTFQKYYMQTRYKEFITFISVFLNLNFRIIDPKIDILLLFCIVNRTALENKVFFLVEMDLALKITIVIIYSIYFQF